MENSSQKIFSLFKKLTLATSLCAMGLPCAADWKIENGVLLDPNGKPFVFRGVTIQHDHVIAPEKTVQAIKDAAALGANAVQVELSLDYLGTLTTIEQARNIVQACYDNKVVCVLEPSNIAGYPEVANRFNHVLSFLFWDTPSMRPAIASYHDYVMFGLGNQALGSRNEVYQYLYNIEDSANSFQQRFPRFMVIADGNQWGQDTNKAMQELATKNVQNGTGKNLIYSLEVGDTYADPQKVRDYVANFSRIGAPLVIGGFSPVPYYHPHYPNTRTPTLQLPAAAVMEAAQHYGAGYFAWSWNGNNNPALDLTVDGNPLNLTAWGNLAFNDVNGIKATAKPATHFTDVRPNTPPSVSLFATVHYYGCASAELIARDNGSRDPDGDPLTYRWEVNGQVLSTPAVTSINFPMDPQVNYTITLTVSDGRGGVASTSQTLTATGENRCSSSSTVTLSSSSYSIPSTASSSSIRPSSSSSSLIPSSASSLSSRSSSSAAAKAICTYIINSQWSNGFTGAIRIKNTSAQTISGWSVNWQYADTTKVTSAWNATLSGSNPYTAINQSWNANIQPGQTLEFGFQGTKPAGTTVAPVVKGGICQ